MSNMSYCRFQNTRPDLEDCVEALEEQDDDIDLTPGESLLFWSTLSIAIFAVGGFCAGLLYSFI